MVNLNKLHAFLHKEISNTQQKYKEQTDKRCIPVPEFSIGSEVYLSAKHICTTCLMAKFSEKYLGPFKVIAQPFSLSYTLQLPDYLWAVHLVFHVSQIESASLNMILNQAQTKSSHGF